MHFTNPLATTALALTANAFLIPLEIADDFPAANGKAVSSPISHHQQSVDLDCPSCPFALATERHGVHEWTNDVESCLRLDFEDKENHLLLNGEPFYPATLKHLPGALYAPQINNDNESTLDGYKKGLKLSYTLDFETEKMRGGNELVKISMSILGIDEQMIKIDNVAILAVKEADGSLSLSGVSVVPASPNDPDAKCTNMMCRVMAKLGAAMAKARAKAASAATATGSAAKKVKCFCMRCFHRAAGHPGAVHGGDGATRLPTHNVARPGHFGAHRGSGMYHGHRHHKGFLRSMLGFARHLFTFVLLPVMVGFAVGITASAIGMLVGQAVVFLWLRYRRSGATPQGTYEPVESEDKEEGLPAYDAEGLPAYVDVEANNKETDAKA